MVKDERCREVDRVSQVFICYRVAAASATEEDDLLLPHQCQGNLQLLTSSGTSLPNATSEVLVELFTETLTRAELSV